MAASPSILASCLEAADAVESAVDRLGDTSQWPADQTLRQRCLDFRQACRDVASQKGVSQFAVAFLGPKNAGKTSLLSELLRNTRLKESLAQGEDLAGATNRILWLTSQPLADLDRRHETMLPVEKGDLLDLGCDYTLIDVPGANEANPERAAAARRALRAAHLKVLVIEARTMEDAGLLDHVRFADGATLLPVINQIRPGIDPGDIEALMRSLEKTLPKSRLLPPLRIPDFHLADEDEERARETARRELCEAIQSVIRPEHLEAFLDPQLRRMKERFEEEMEHALLQALPATAEAAKRLKAIESRLAVQALEKLLGETDSDGAVLAGLRQQLRSVFQQRTPVLFFPWRIFLGLANLLHGALEKVPLLLAGSLPSLVSSAMTAVKNVTRDREFSEQRDTGLRQHAKLLVRERLAPLVDQLEAAIRSDLRQENRDREREELQVEFEGLDLLQSRSTRLFQKVLDRQAPGHLATGLTGGLGVALFWSLFVWPCLALYRDYFDAIGVFLGDSASRAAFPTESFATLGTAFLLALFPMLLWLLLVLSWVASQSRAVDCLDQLRQGHRVIVDELNDQHLLQARLHHPPLHACLRLFSLRSTSSKRE